MPQPCVVASVSVLVARAMPAFANRLAYNALQNVPFWLAK